MAERARAKAKRTTTKKTTKTKEKSPRGSGNTLGDSVQDEIYDRHIKIISRHDNVVAKIEEQLKQAKGERSAALKVAKADGVNIDALKDAFKLHKQDHNVVVIDQHDIGRVLRIMKSPLATQMELFQNVVIPSPVNAALAGAHAGRTGEDRQNNPHTPGSEEFQMWDDAWMEEQAKIVRKMGPDKAAPGYSTTEG